MLIAGLIVWAFLWMAGWWFAGVLPAAVLIWLWWLGAPDHNLTYAAVLLAPCAARFLFTPKPARVQP